MYIPPIKTWSIRTQVMAGPLLLFMILILVLAAAGYSTIQMRRADANMAETLAILHTTNRLARLVVDMETAVRGFALAGDEQFLSPYRDAELDIPGMLAELDARIAGRPIQRGRLAQLVEQIDDWRTSVAEVEIEMVRGGQDPSPMVRSAVGRMRMEEIRRTLSEIEAAEGLRLEAQTQEHVAANRILMALYGVAMLLAVGGIAFSMWMGQRIARPVAMLGEAADRVAAGNYHVVFPEAANDSRNELGRTRHAFNLMVEAILQGRAALRAESEDAAAQARRAERAHSETLAVLDAVSEAIMVVSPDQRIVTANRRVEQLFGVTPDELMKQSREELARIHTRTFVDPAMVNLYIAEALSHAAEPARMVVAQQWPETRDLELFTAPVMDGAGVYHGHVFAFRDITKERDADRMKNEFVSMVSHELRTPLTSIKGFVDLMASGDAGPLSEEQAEFLEVVKNNADRLVALVNDLLDISRLEAGRVELKRTNIAVDALLRSLLVSLRPQLEAKGHRVVQEFAPHLPPVYGDAERLTQIFVNLISNAVKFTPSKGTITVAARPAGEQVQIEITDTGIGLSEADQARLFTRFFRAKNRATQEAGGTGLGLSITKSLVEMHGGQISVRSAPGEGSTFTVSLPVTSGEYTEKHPTLFPGGRILVVEDEPDIAELIRVYLTRAGYEVDIVHEAATALAQVKSDPPDLILLDVVMPGVDGMTLLTWLKSDEEIAAIPVVLLSILPDDGQGRILGAVDYLHKPVEKERLLNRIGAIMAADQSPLVLIVDNDISEREHIRGLLHRAGYRTMTAETDEEVILRMSEEPPDLILLDLPSSQEGSDNIFDLITQSEAMKSTPIVVMTGKLAEEAEEGFPAVETIQHVGFLTKPFTAEELAQALGARGQE